MVVYETEKLVNVAKIVLGEVYYREIARAHIVFEPGTLHEISLIIPANGRIRAPASSVRGNEFNVVVEK